MCHIKMATEMPEEISFVFMCHSEMATEMPEGIGFVLWS